MGWYAFWCITWFIHALILTVLFLDNYSYTVLNLQVTLMKTSKKKKIGN